MLNISPRTPHKVFFADCEEASGIYNVGTAIKIDSCSANDGGNLVIGIK